MNVHFDAIIVTAIPEEWYAVGDVFGLEPEDAIKNDTDQYFSCHIREGDNEGNTKLIGRNLNIGIFCAIRAGNHSMAATTANLIGKFNPSVMILAGIAAGKKDDKVMIGDVITPGMILDYSTTEAKESDKQSTTEAKESDKQSTTVIYALRNISHNTPPVCLVINDLVAAEMKRSKQIKVFPVKKRNEEEEITVYVATNELASENNNLCEYTHTNVHEKRINKAYPKLLDGVLASANILSRAPSLFKELFRFNSQLRGLEMESAGFATACDKANVPWIVGKSICDWGDEDKSDGTHRYAALTSAVWAKSFAMVAARKGFLFSQSESNPSMQKREFVIALLTYLGKILEYKNPKLKMNIQVYSYSRRRNGRTHLYREVGLTYCGEPGIRSGRTQSLNIIDIPKVTSSKSVDMCVCVAARDTWDRDTRINLENHRRDGYEVKSRSGTSYEAGFFFDKVQYNTSDYSSALSGKVSPRQKWVIAYPMSLNSHKFMVVHSGSNDLFKLVKKDGENDKDVEDGEEIDPVDLDKLKAIDDDGIISVLNEEWKVIERKIKELLVTAT